ncbi:hypothetical protein RFI_14949, partial [Reticulomyxa filosa]
MGKGRFTALDVRAIVTELKQCVLNLRVSNIYDLNSRTYLMKLAGEDKRFLVILESGVRCHITNYAREKPEMPNYFASKLRRYLKTRKLTNVEQLGRDRIIKFTFGTKPTLQMHLILEMYSGGNIILCDYNDTMLAVLRTVSINKANPTEKDTLTSASGPTAINTTKVNAVTNDAITTVANQ